MRSHKKIAFMIAAAMLPSLAFGLDTDPKPETKETPAKYLSMVEAQKAFGPEFGAEKNKEGTIAFLWGVTSTECFNDAFEIKPDAKRGEYTIFYKGKKEDCLEHAKQKAAASSENKLVGLSTIEELKMKLDGSFESLNLRYEDPTSDKNRVRLDAFKDADDALISHKSAADLLEEKKQEEEKRVADTLDASMNFVASCGRNLTELDLVDKVIEELADSKLVAGDDKKVAKLAEARKKANEKIYKACKLQIERGKMDQLADCGERLKKLAMEDDTYTKKVKDAYIALVGRLMNSTRLSLEEAYDAATDVIALIREFDLDEKEEKNLIASERNMQFHFLRRAAMEGADSENFQLIREKTLDFMLEADLEDDVVCLNDDGSVRPEMRLATACADSARMSAVLNQNTQFAVGTQKAAEAKAATELKLAQEKELLDRCTFNRQHNIQMIGDEEYRCNFAIAKRDAEAKAVLNAGVSSNGHGQVVNPQTTQNGVQPVQTTDQSGFNTTGYGAQNQNVANPNTNVTNTAPIQNTTVQPAQNVTVNTVPTLGRR